MSDLSIVPLKNNLLLDWKKQDLKNKIIARVNELNINISNYKTNEEFIILICNLVEYLVSKKDNLIKKELVVAVFNELFGLTEDEQEHLKNSIDIIHLQKKIKKISYYKMFICSVSEYFRKK
jgi:hypothetical protein